MHPLLRVNGKNSRIDLLIRANCTASYTICDSWQIYKEEKAQT